MMARPLRLNPLFSGPMLLAHRVRLAQGGPVPAFYPQQATPDQQLAQTGAVVDVQINIPSSYASAGGKGTPQTIKAMIDTGASISGIDNQVANAVGLQAVGSTQLGGVGGVTQTPIYAAALSVPQYGVNIDPIQIAGLSNPLPDVSMLLGRDLLHNLRLDYHGGEGAFTLTQDQPAAGAPPAAGQPIPTQPIPGMPPPAAHPAAPPAAAPAPAAAAGGGMSTGTIAAIGGGAVAALAAAGHFIFKLF